MTLEKKRQLLREFCGSTYCLNCPLDVKNKWSTPISSRSCLNICNSCESEIDEALRIIGKLEKVEEKSVNPYWERITEIANRQRSKGLKEYGRGVEEDTANVDTRLDRIEEELIDALMYLEHLRDAIHNIREVIR